LDLSNRGFRFVDPLSRENFSSLTKVNVEGNSLESIDELLFLPSLVELNASSNAIKEIFSVFPF
jgi:Leucine-rich repeat (LRR) protein